MYERKGVTSRDFWSDDNKNRGGRKTWPRPAASLRPGRGVDAGDAAFLGTRLRRHVIRRADRGHAHQPIEFLQFLRQQRAPLRGSNRDLSRRFGRMVSA